ncbi:NUDIX domain-containing protein [Streptomyces sp. TRM 70351]|uniref:NUDIX hydrolase n=1 Tax=Streptomyces sp. TRM 70351 TaxID=3116552 RepID=UPI002E7ACDE3|nr:NUDIX domain-containing protein [Streptomyces sp. TRM 70351]MEE1927280.1 NUDIX domain-containing protein [Streptomyces sp. TRM 70351]
MATPDYIRELRATVGRRLLFLPGVTAIVHDEAGRVLLGRRADTGRWAVIGGICEPGEQPAETAVREVFEETGVRCVAEQVVLVETREPVRYPNGDVCQFLDITFRCRALPGSAADARVNDDESLEVGWFAPGALPDLEPFGIVRIERAAEGGPTGFVPAPAAAAPEAADGRPRVPSGPGQRGDG